MSSPKYSAVQKTMRASPKQDSRAALSPIPAVQTTLRMRDILGRWKARWGIGRMRFRTQPGLYAVGSPDRDSPVFVTANYRMSFDYVRQALAGIDSYILVLDTRGINVWCAAGKGTFGTRELVARVESTGLGHVVNHRELILPQLGAVGVAAHEVKKASGFSVRYGPVRAADIRGYMQNGKIKTPQMARVTFTLAERLAVAPVEIAHSWKLALPVVVASILLSLPFSSFFELRLLTTLGPLLGYILAGTLVFPALLPWLPFRAFSLKGAVLGAAWAIISAWIFDLSLLPAIMTAIVGIPLCGFLSLQFTGSSTYTNLDGVALEVKISMPIMVSGCLAGIIGLAALNFFL